MSNIMLTLGCQGLNIPGYFLTKKFFIIIYAIILNVSTIKGTVFPTIEDTWDA